MNPWSVLIKPLRDRPGIARRKDAPPPCEKPTLTLVHRAEPEKIDAEDVARAHEILPINPWHLTERQVQVLGLAVQGLNRAQIAVELDISLSTTSQHLAEIRVKMKAPTTAQAVVLWHRFYRVTGPKDVDCDKDDLLIANLHRVTMAQRAAKDKT